MGRRITTSGGICDGPVERHSVSDCIACRRRIRDSPGEGLSAATHRIRDGCGVRDRTRLDGEMAGGITRGRYITDAACEMNSGAC
jgi:hypothetical protein